MSQSADVNNLKEYKATEALEDGSTLLLRAIRRDDENRLFEFFHRLSDRSLYLRFHSAFSGVSREEVSRLCSVDYYDTFALVGIISANGEEKIIADGRFFRLPRRDAAEVSMIVDDAYQGKGIAGHLLNHLATMARSSEIRYFESEVLAENKPMMKVFKKMGLQLEQGLDQGVYSVILRIEPTEIIEETSAEREKVAAVARIRSFLNPHSIALVGASRKAKSVGEGLLQNIMSQRFNGLVYPVNPKVDIMASIKAYHSVLHIPDEVDLAVVAVPAEKVQDVVNECGQKGVKGVVVISAGFEEGDVEGENRQEALLKATREYGMPLIGPNCLGVMNTDPNINLNATLSSVYPPTGNIGICSEGGTLGRALLEYAYNENIGISSFVNLGNRADISSNDFIEYWEADPRTDVILLYLESFGNPRRFTRISSRVAATKPLLAVYRGRMQAGSRSTNLVGAPLITTEIPSEDLFAQIGIIRCDTMRQLFNVATLVASQPLPRSKKVAIISNGKGPASITAHACVALGLELPTIMDVTASELKEILPRRATLKNPIDMTAEASAEDYERTLKLLVEDAEIDSVIVICIPPVDITPDPVVNAIRDAAPQYYKRGKTLVASLSGLQGHSIQVSKEPKIHVPSYALPETAANALAKAYKYTEWLKKSKGSAPELGGIDRERAAKIVNSSLQGADSETVWLDYSSSTELLACYGIHTVRGQIVTSAEEAIQAAEEIGSAVAIKLLSTTIALRAEVGGVILGLNSPGEVEQAFDTIRKRLASVGRENEMQGVIVQEMIEGGVEVMAGVTQHNSFGPLIMFGAGGVYAELFRDMAFRVNPLTNVNAQEMVRSVKAYRLLEGFKGAEPADIRSLEELLLRLSAMVEDIPQIAELDLNPIKALEKGKCCVVIDSRIMLSGIPSA